MEMMPRKLLFWVVVAIIAVLLIGAFVSLLFGIPKPS
jgi:hypothetical protein